MPRPRQTGRKVFMVVRFFNGVWAKMILRGLTSGAHGFASVGWDTCPFAPVGDLGLPVRLWRIRAFWPVWGKIKVFLGMVQDNVSSLPNPHSSHFHYSIFYPILSRVDSGLKICYTLTNGLLKNKIMKRATTWTIRRF